MNRFLITWAQKQPYVLPTVIILIGLVFVTSVSLACNAPSNDGELAATQIALNVKATQLSLQENQAEPQSASDSQSITDQSSQGTHATQTARAATQIAFDVQSTINAKVVFKKEISDVQVLKDQVELEIRRFLNPIVGGPDGNGWPFGVPVAKNDIYSVLEKIEGVYYIEDIELINDLTGVSVEKIELEEDNLIYLSKVSIQERRIQF